MEGVLGLWSEEEGRILSGEFIMNHVIMTPGSGAGWESKKFGDKYFF